MEDKNKTQTKLLEMKTIMLKLGFASDTKLEVPKNPTSR